MKTPIGLVIFHLQTIMDRKTRTNMRNNKPIEQATPPELTATGAPFTRVDKSQGNGKLQKKIKLSNKYTIEL